MVTGNDFFSDLRKNEPAPDWLSERVETQWQITGPITVTLLSVSENASFLITAAGEPYAVLRLNRPGYIGGIVPVESEAIWLTAIAANTDVPVTVPIRGNDGAFVQRFQSNEGESLTGMIAAHIPGEILEDVAAPLPWFDQIGRETAKLHTHARIWHPPGSFERFEWDIPDMVGSTARWGRWEDAQMSTSQFALLSKAQDRAREVVSELSRDARNWGLIHADIRPSNVIVDQRQMTIIDFDDCGYGWFWHDFAAAMTWLDHLPEAPELAHAWVNGYREIAPSFSTADALTACSLDALRSLTMLGWTTTHRREAVPAPVRDVIVETACEVANAYLASPTWLLD